MIRERAFIGRINSERVKSGGELLPVTPSREITARKSWTLGAMGMMTGGFVLLNDAVKVSQQVLRAVEDRLWVTGRFVPAPTWQELLQETLAKP